tara:strand:+ start:314 stop:1633 length:1320 start_codon:yes stop_codon:yes gene_type:complete
MPFKSEKQRRWMHANKPKMAKKWEKKEKMKKETHVRQLIKKIVREIMSEMNEGFAGALKKEDRKKFDKGRRKQSEVLGYTLTGKDDIKTEIDDATVHEAKIKPKQKISKKEWSKIKKFNKHIGQDGTYYVMQLTNKGTALVPVIVEEKLTEKAKRDYKAEYKKFQSSTKSKKYRAELNKYNRQKGTYGNGDKKDASHKGGKIVGFEEQSKNRGRREKSRLKKEACQKGYKTHPTRKTKIMFGKRYRNCIKAEDIQKISEDKIYSKADGLKKVKSISKKGKVYKVDKQKAKYNGKNITMYTLYTKYKNHTSGQNPFGLDMARNSKGEAMYLVPIQEGKLNEKMDRKKAAIILKQIGGNRFIAMTGAKGFAFSDKYMSFKIGRNSKGINFVRIGHNAKDLYDMEFGFVSTRGIKVKKKVKDIYADMLGQIFTKYTGMRTSL